MTPASELPSPGRIARVRQRLYLVEGIVPPPEPRDSTLVRLSCVDDDAQGQLIEVLWEKEVDAEVLTGEAWDAIAKRGFDEQRGVFSSSASIARYQATAVPVSSTTTTAALNPATTGLRRHQRPKRSTWPTGRAWTGSPFRNPGRPPGSRR
jgi:hypothetical protein